MTKLSVAKALTVARDLRAEARRRLLLAAAGRSDRITASEIERFIGTGHLSPSLCQSLTEEEEELAEIFLATNSMIYTLERMASK